MFPFLFFIGFSKICFQRRVLSRKADGKQGKLVAFAADLIKTHESPHISY